MNKVLSIIIEGLIVYILIWLFNYIAFARPKKKKKNEETPLELIYISSIYNVDANKINLKNFKITYCFINAFIITTDYLLVVYLVKTMIVRIILGIVIVVLLIIICYGLLGKYYANKQNK